MRTVRAYWSSMCESGFAVDKCLVRHRFSNVRVCGQHSLAHEVMNVSSAQFNTYRTVGSEIVALRRKPHAVGKPSVSDSAVAGTRIDQTWHAQREQGNYKGHLLPDSSDGAVCQGLLQKHTAATLIMKRSVLRHKRSDSCHMSRVVPYACASVVWLDREVPFALWTKGHIFRKCFDA